MERLRTSIDRLHDIVHAIDEVADMIAGMDEARFNADRRTRLAVEPSVEIVSEASRHVRAEQKARYPDVPWNDVAGIGNVLRHGYDKVVPSVIWLTASRSLPELRPVIVALLADADT